MRPTKKMLSRPVEARKEKPPEKADAPADPRAEAMKARRDAIEKRLLVLKGMKASGNLLGTIRTFREVVKRMAASPPKPAEQAASASAADKGDTSVASEGSSGEHCADGGPQAAKWAEAVAKAKKQLDELERNTAERMDKRIASLDAQLRGIEGAIESYEKRAEHEKQAEHEKRAKKPVIPGNK